MATGENDRYANLASAKVAANGATISFAELQTGISLGQNLGILIDHIEYYYNTTDVSGLADGEVLTMAWTLSNTLTSLDPDIRGVIDTVSIFRIDDGAPANSNYLYKPQIKYFTPPLIVANPRIYLAVVGPAAAANNSRSRFSYRYIRLSDKEYLEIAEAFLLIS